MEFQKNESLKFIENEDILLELSSIDIKKYHNKVFPKKVYESVLSVKNDEGKMVDSPLSNLMLKRKSIAILDFGEHCVGKVSFSIGSKGSPPDAPAKIRLFFAETIMELERIGHEYRGELSSSWIQEELITIDILPNTIDLLRRFAFRYIYIEVIDTSPKYDIMLNFCCDCESSVDVNNISTVKSDRYNLLEKIDYVSQVTLAHCMQDVFEDGPKRDRRLWLGDLRLQAKANYYTFKNYDLVKKCLYLFAAKISETGQLSANVFIYPEVIPDDTFLADYSLFFIDVLLDYYNETKDEETLNNLYRFAKQQYIVLSKFIDDNGKIHIPEGWWAFVDWNDSLDKTISIYGIFIYCLKKLYQLSIVKSEMKFAEELKTTLKLIEQYVISNFFNTSTNLFVNVETNQVSIPSQVWMVLAEVGTKKNREEVLLNVLKNKDKIVGCNTPYMYHHFAEALLEEGYKEEAIEVILDYWGGMINLGADTFWEVYNPNDVTYSPYGDPIINSYCHAWSCTPCYLIRKYKLHVM